MEGDNFLAQKAKLIIFGLVLVVLISVFFVFKANMDRKADLEKFKKIEADLSRENKALAQKFSSAQQEKRALEDKYNAVQRDLERVSSERDEFKQKYELISKEREDLLAKIKKPVEPVSGVSAGVSREDSYWADTLREKANLEVQLRNLQEQLQTMKIKIDEAERDKQELLLEANALSQAKMDLERQVDYNNKLSSSLARDLAREKEDKKMITHQLAKTKEENGFLRKRLQQTTTSKINLEKQIQAVESERNTLRNRVAELDQIMQDRMEDLIQIKKELELARIQTDQAKPGESQDIELPPIVVRSSKERPIRSDALYGQILAVNRENNFVIIDLGETSGVVPGQEYRVYQDNRDIATLVVIQTRKDISAADIKEIKPNRQLRVGDLVKK